MEKGKIQFLNEQSIRESLKSIEFKLIQKPGRPTEHLISGNDSHVVEGIVRAVWLATEDTSLDLWVA